MIEPNDGISAMLLVLNALNGVVAENNELRSCDMSAPPIFLFEFEKILTLTRKRFKRFCLRLLARYWLPVRTGLERFLDASVAFFATGFALSDAILVEFPTADLR